MPFALCAVMPPADLAAKGAGGANAPREVIGPFLEAVRVGLGFIGFRV